MQWQIARLVTLGHINYEDVSVPALDTLKGTNQATAPLVDRLFCKSIDGESEGISGFFSKEKEATVSWTLSHEIPCSSAV